MLLFEPPERFVEFRDRAEYRAGIAKLREFDWDEQIAEQYFTAMCFALPNNGKATKLPKPLMHWRRRKYFRDCGPT